MFHTGYIKTIVTSVTGAQIPLVYMCEWQATVPMMFFLVQSLNSSKKHLATNEVFAIVCIYLGITLSVFCYIADYFHQFLLGFIGCCLFIIGNYISITQAIDDVKTTHATFIQSLNANVDEYIAHKVALKRYESSIILFVIFITLTFLYYAVQLGLMTGRTSFTLVIIVNCLAKNFYSQILTSGHLKVLDYSSYQLLSQRKLNSDRRTFLRFLFHELRSPLNCIHMGLQLANPKDSDETLCTVQNAATEINDLLDDSLLLQSIQEGSLILNKRPIKLSEIAQYLKSAYIEVLKERSVIVKMRLEKGVPEYVMGDIQYIRRVLDNLVLAINQHIDTSEHLEVDVTISYSVDDSILSVECADNDKNFRTETTQTFNYGEYKHHDLKVGRLNSLRMSICNQIVISHGGLFGFELSPKGPKFGFLLPLDYMNSILSTEVIEEVVFDSTKSIPKVTPVAPITTNTDIVTPNNSANGFQGEIHAIVVDDIKTNRQLLARLINNRGVKVDDMFEDGKKAADFVKDNTDKTNIIFMDNMMPIMTGIESTAAIRSSGYGGLIIGVTGNTLGEELTAFLDAGADIILGKPVNCIQLDTIIAHIRDHGIYSPKSKVHDSRNNEGLKEKMEKLTIEVKKQSK
jgi:signal transduction histidine kinase/DNA-binding NarL/FixJ family response regulator